MSVEVEHRILFNFAASPVGGGLKRLYEYAKWFDAHGGARFIVHPKCEGLQREFERNEFVVARQSSASRVLSGVRAVGEVCRAFGTPDCYYAYGIPIHEPVGVINWFHLSNVLPFSWRRVPMPLRDKLKFAVLGQRFRQFLQNADVISAESQSSLALVDVSDRTRLFCSVNGSDDELEFLASDTVLQKEPLATTVGTYRHKALDDSCHVFDMLKRNEPDLRLAIFGAPEPVPSRVSRRPDVIMMGSRRRSDVIATLRKSQYYISMTRIENVYNAASEGIFIADESYISDIGPHRELLAGMPYDHAVISTMARPFLRVRRREISGANLKSWNDVILEMLARMRVALGTRESTQSGAHTYV